MDLYSSDLEPAAPAAPRSQARGVSEANALLGVMAAIAVLGAGAAYIAFNLGKSSEKSRQEVASAVAPSATTPDRLIPPTPPAPPALREAAVPSPLTAAADASAGTDEGPFPRLKPRGEGGAAAQPAAAQDEGDAHLQGKALALGEPVMAPADDRPVSALFVEDGAANRIPPPPMPVVYARDISEGPRVVDIALERGETFVDALRRAGIRADDRNAATAAFGAHQNLRLLRPGQTMRATVAPPNETLFQTVGSDEQARLHLLSLDFRPAPGERIVLKRGLDGAFSAMKKDVPLVARTVSVAGLINGSVYASAKRVGAPDEVIAQLSDVFAYDVDFQREIFGGDEFEALFEVKYDDTGAVVSASDVLYARLKFRGRTKEKAYYRFVTDEGLAEYFDRSGESAKRLLMKTPIDGARLSSGFGSRRHPILGYMKQHKGVDFAAPTGTPIKAAGDGVVERAGPFSTFGNYVKIRHNSGYETAYAHLSRFASGMKSGRRVRQGDIIGYVGTTGRSTGPHLHYEVHFKGSPVNPQNLKVATGIELGGAELKKFRAQRDRIDAMRTGLPRKPGLLAKDERKSTSL